MFGSASASEWDSLSDQERRAIAADLRVQERGGPIRRRKITKEDDDGQTEEQDRERRR
jgi:predicted Fe-S protein YdhL (DUF1289 family)